MSNRLISTALLLLVLSACSSMEECDCEPTLSEGVGVQTLEREPREPRELDGRESIRERREEREAREREQARRREARRAEIERCMADPECRRSVSRGRISEVINGMAAQDLWEVNRLLRGLSTDGQVNSLGIGIRTIGCDDSVFDAWIESGTVLPLRCPTPVSEAASILVDYAARQGETAFLDATIKGKIDRFSDDELEEVIRYELLGLPESEREQFLEQLNRIIETGGIGEFESPVEVASWPVILRQSAPVIRRIIIAIFREVFRDPDDPSRLREERDELREQLERERAERERERQEAGERERELEDQILRHELDKATDEMDEDLVDFILNDRQNDA